VEIHDLLGGVAKRGGWVVVGGAVGALAAVVATALTVPRYEAVVDVVIGQVSQSLRYGQVRVDPIEDPEVVLRLVRSSSFARGIRQDVGEGPVSVQATLVRTPKNESTRFIEIRVVGATPSLAERAAEAAAMSIAERHSQRFREWMALNQQYEQRLEAQIAKLEGSEVSGERRQTWDALSVGSWLEARGRELSELLSSLRELQLDTYSQVRAESTVVVGPPVVVRGGRPWSRGIVLGFLVGVAASALVIGGVEATRG
jgi:hypothetical protein